MVQTKRQLEVAAVNRYVAEARRRGRSHFQKDWHTDEFKPSALEGLVDSMVEWCRHSMAGCRRPYGIDFFDLIVTYHLDKNDRPRSFRLNRLEPMTLYQELLPAQLLDRLKQALTAEQPIAEQPIKVRVSAGFFSWGDAAYKALTASSASR